MDSAASSTAAELHFNSTPALALQALLSRSIDYAGLFPPAELALQPALKNHAQYASSDEAWMLNSFVLPTRQFSAAASHFSQFDRSVPLRISALVGKTAGSDFREALAAALEAIRQLESANVPGVSVVQLEIALPADCELKLLNDIHAETDRLGLRVFCEAPPADAQRVIELLAQSNAEKAVLLGYKLRTGGVTADAFPTSGEIARALVAAGGNQVPIKFTAGLHHPVRQFRDEVKAKMHGFLNVLGAGVLAAEHNWDVATTAKMLDDEETAAFTFEQGTFAWRNWKITAAAITARRELVTSFGSCSFDEPREDLRALQLL